MSIQKVKLSEVKKCADIEVKIKHNDIIISCKAFYIDHGTQYVIYMLGCKALKHAAHSFKIPPISNNDISLAFALPFPLDSWAASDATEPCQCRPGCKMSGIRIKIDYHKLRG